jgi:hypothetical protein
VTAWVWFDRDHRSWYLAPASYAGAFVIDGPHDNAVAAFATKVCPSDLLAVDLINPLSQRLQIRRRRKSLNAQMKTGDALKWSPGG